MTSEQWEHFAGDAFTGFDTDRTMLRLSAMNLILHSITHPHIEYKDSVSKQNDIIGKYDAILANPPFKGTVDEESIHDNLRNVTNTKKTELLFLALFLRILQRSLRISAATSEKSENSVRNKALAPKPKTKAPNNQTKAPTVKRKLKNAPSK